MDLKSRLGQIKKEKRMGIMTHVVVGYPTLETTIQLAKIMADSGVDFIELQIPFSDPLADGPTIMKACERALENGTKVKDAFLVMKTLSQEISIPLFFMAYYNTVFRYGTQKFCRDAKRAGATGLIIPDMPLEEENREHYFSFCKKYNLYNIQVISPASTKERLRKNANVANGFVYCTARQGITGVKEDLNPTLTNYLKTVKSFFNIPLAVGFGISKPLHVRVLKGKADIAVVGSALIDIVNSSSKTNLENNVRSFIASLKSS